MDDARERWRTLLCPDRLRGGRDRDDDGRSAFERDYGRILFSNAFRRLHNKTQVFPVPENDHVHSRLTHSLEVADVGRSMGKQIGIRLQDRYGLDAAGVEPEHFAEILSAACLAHDIGNPPFGHAGEDAIGHFFTDGAGSALIADLDDQRRQDLTCFEGNAQGFRILTRTTMYRNDGGMRLCKAVLAAFSKYPQASRHRGDRERAGGKKFGFTADDQDLFAEVAESCGLEPVADRPGAWHRHPLAYLMEAADDICYNVLDLEDGSMLKLIDDATLRDCFGALLDVAPAELAGQPATALRARAIGKLVDEVVRAFLDNEAELREGRYPQSLTDAIASAEALQGVFAVNMARCYRAPVVLGLEQAGYHVIGSLLNAFCDAVFGRRNPRFARLLGEALPEDDDPYRRLLAVCDYISGMTDRFAVRLHQQVTGVSLSSV